MVLRAVSSLSTYHHPTSTPPYRVFTFRRTASSMPRNAPRHVAGETACRVRRGAGDCDGHARCKSADGPYRLLAWPEVQPGRTRDAGDVAGGLVELGRRPWSAVPGGPDFLRGKVE